MPEAVQTYVDTKNFTAVLTIQKQLLLYYAGYFSKHAPETGIQKNNQVWNSISAQLAKENKKFIFGLVQDGGRAKDFKLAVQWLHDCGLIHTVYRVTVPKIPLVSYKEMNVFKIFLHDVGQLAASCKSDCSVSQAERQTFFASISSSTACIGPGNHTRRIIPGQRSHFRLSSYIGCICIILAPSKQTYCSKQQNHPAQGGSPSYLYFVLRKKSSCTFCRLYLHGTDTLQGKTAYADSTSGTISYFSAEVFLYD